MPTSHHRSVLSSEDLASVAPDAACELFSGPITISQRCHPNTEISPPSLFCGLESAVLADRQAPPSVGSGDTVI